MTLFNPRPAKATGDQMVFGNGQFVVPSGSLAAPNFQIQTANMSVLSPGTSQLAPVQTVSPKGSRVPIFINPDGTQPGSPLNQTATPRGMASGIIPPSGSEFLLDFTGFPGDIIFAAANLFKQSRGINTQQAYVSAVDNINNLVYVQVANSGNTAAATAAAGSIIAWEIAFKDSFTA